MPSWLKNSKDNRFEAFYRDYDLLLFSGYIVFAHIIQANSILFSAGKEDAPAAIVFSLDDYYDDHVADLLQIGLEMYDLKGRTIEDPELREFADALTNEMTALFNVTLPTKMSGGRLVYYSSLMVCRKHLPVGYLTTPWFPILVRPEISDACMILPSKYWAPELIQHWSML